MARCALLEMGRDGGPVMECKLRIKTSVKTIFISFMVRTAGWERQALANGVKSFI